MSVAYEEVASGYPVAVGSRCFPDLLRISSKVSPNNFRFKQVFAV